MPYKTCLLCGGPAEIGFVQTGISFQFELAHFAISIEKFFGNGSYILSNGVIVLSDVDLELYLSGEFILPDCKDCCDHSNDCGQTECEDILNINKFHGELNFRGN